MTSEMLQYKLIHMIGVKQVLRYEQIIKEYLQNYNIKLLSIENDGRILVEIEKEQKIFRAELAEDTIRIYNVYTDLLYTIELK